MQFLPFLETCFWPLLNWWSCASWDLDLSTVFHLLHWHLFCWGIVHFWGTPNISNVRTVLSSIMEQQAAWLWISWMTKVPVRYCSGLYVCMSLRQGGTWHNLCGVFIAFWWWEACHKEMCLKCIFESMLFFIVTQYQVQSNIWTVAEALNQ